MKVANGPGQNSGHVLPFDNMRQTGRCDSTRRVPAGDTDIRNQDGNAPVKVSAQTTPSELRVYPGTQGAEGNRLISTFSPILRHACKLLVITMLYLATRNKTGGSLLRDIWGMQ